MNNDVVKCSELDAKLIEQEHRTLRIFLNAYVALSYKKNDPRKLASINALIYRLVFGGSKVILLGGIVAWATLYYTAKQTDVMIAQSDLMAKELAFNLRNSEKQQWVNNLSRRTNLIKALYMPTDDNEKSQSYSARLRSEAVVEYIELQRIIANISKKKFHRNQKLPMDSAMYKFGVDLTGANLRRVRLSQIDFTSVILQNADFKNSSLFSSNFTNASLELSNMSYAGLDGIDISGASLIGADLRGSNLQEIIWNKETKVFLANIYGVKNASNKFVKWALSQGAINEPNESKWHDQLRKYNKKLLK